MHVANIKYPCINFQFLSNMGVNPQQLVILGQYRDYS